MSKLLFLLFAGPFYLISLLPLKIHYFVSDIIIFIIGRMLRYRQSVVTINITRSFPELRYGQIEERVKAFYGHLAEIIAESMWMVSASRKKLNKIAHFHNPELLKMQFAAGKSVIIVGGHIGNWELLTKMDHFGEGNPVGYSGDELKFIYKKQHSSLSDKFVRWIRESRSGIELIESNKAARYILKNRDKQACYFLFADQAPLPGSKFVTNMLNQQTLMINGPEIISRGVDCPVIFINMVRVKRGCYKIKFTLITDKPSECEDGFITNRYAQLIESSVRDNPENWLWSHKRWKRGLEDNIIKG
jgi:KDO2-lipid IV(A) lauroyltransferase